VLFLETTRHDLFLFPDWLRLTVYFLEGTLHESGLAFGKKLHLAKHFGLIGWSFNPHHDPFRSLVFPFLQVFL